MSRIALSFRDFCALQWILAMERYPRLTVWLVQSIIFVASGLAAFLIRFDFTIPPFYYRHLVWAVAIWLVVKIVVFRWSGLDRGWWRFVSVYDVSRLGAGNLGASLVGVCLILAFAPGGFPRSVYLLDLLICLLATTGVRVSTRIMQDVFLHRGEVAEQKGVLIYGAGEAGVTLLREIRSNAALQYKVLGFVDDNPRKLGAVIQGVKVLGSGESLAGIVLKHRVEEVLIALPSASGRQMITILTRCHDAGVRCRTIPALAEIIRSRSLATQIRDVAVEDLLGRQPVTLEEDRIFNALQNRIVLVTGAGGSIGSELCRQIARFGPAGIVGFEIAESPLFELDNEMRRAHPEIPFYAEIGSIQDRKRLDEVLERYSPSVIYHAAAYKHVPMMEEHVFAAIENNVFGTWNVAAAAAQHGVRDFVMMSTDKAVRPTSLMGATKRVSEVLLLSFRARATKYVAVRFGNVLGSNGSVIPIFKKQIAVGGPVTVTHPEMRRFFMTIPEACQLVLQAGAIGEDRQVCVLDMGEPVKIVDLARNLILLSGLKPDEDIRIEFTGIRPGEKLYEELSTMLEDTVPTGHSKIRIFMGARPAEAEIAARLNTLRDACRDRDLACVMQVLREMVPDYTPSVPLLHRVTQESAGNSALIPV